MYEAEINDGPTTTHTMPNQTRSIDRRRESVLFELGSDLVELVEDLERRSEFELHCVNEVVVFDESKCGPVHFLHFESGGDGRACDLFDKRVHLVAVPFFRVANGYVVAVSVDVRRHFWLLVAVRMYRSAVGQDFVVLAQCRTFWLVLMLIYVQVFTEIADYCVLLLTLTLCLFVVLFVVRRF
jgi:hypothetical protein